jgi:hypothetical protein
MEKYLEELNSGDIFVYNSIFYITTSDFKNNGHRCCIDLERGQFHWFSGNLITKPNNIYYLDTNNNFAPIKNENTKPNIIKN